MYCDMQSHTHICNAIKGKKQIVGELFIFVNNKYVSTRNVKAFSIQTLTMYRNTPYAYIWQSE